MTLRFLLDENIPAVLVEGLRAVGHDVVWVRDIARGADDAVVLRCAIDQRRICVTFDKDFGELVAAGAPADCGIVLLRLPPPRTPHAAKGIIEVLSNREDWSGHFAVLEPGRLRMRPLS